MMKKGKKTLIIAAIVVCVITLLFFGMGFAKRTDMGLMEFALLDDGAEMSIRADVMSSMGFARSCSSRIEGKAIYLTFYSAFGGLNSSVGAKNHFEFSVAPESSEIYIERSNGFELELVKNVLTGEWERAK